MKKKPPVNKLFEILNGFIGVTDESLEHLEIRRLYEDGRARDEASCLKTSEMREVSPEAATLFEMLKTVTYGDSSKKLSEKQKEAAMRWGYRGLPADLALRKAILDANKIKRSITDRCIRKYTKQDTLQQEKTNIFSSEQDCAPESIQLMPKPAYVAEFEYDEEMLEAVKIPFRQALDFRELALRRKGEKGVLYPQSDPTGIGKTRAATDEIARSVMHRIEAVRAAARNNEKSEVSVIVFLVPTHALGAEPANRIESELARMNHRKGDEYDLIRLKSARDELEKTHSESSRKNLRPSYELPDKCPVKNDANWKNGGSGHKFMRALYVETNKELPSEAMKILIPECKKKWGESIKREGCLPEACTGCKSRNPGGVVFHRSNKKPLVRVVFMTYHKFFHGLSFAVQDGKDGGYGRYVFEGTEKGVNKNFPKCTWIFEEAVAGYTILAEKMASAGEVDLLKFCNQFVSGYKFVDEYVSRASEALRLPGYSDDWAKALIGKISVAAENSAKEFQASIAQFYVLAGRGNNSEPTSKYHPFANVSSPGHVRMFINDNDENSTVGFKMATDISFETLSSSKSAVYTFGENFASEQGSRRCNMYIHARPELEGRTQHSLIPAIQSLHDMVAVRAASYVTEMREALEKVLTTAESELIQNEDKTKACERAISNALRAIDSSEAILLKDHSLAKEMILMKDSLNRSMRQMRINRKEQGGGPVFLDAAEKLRMVGSSVLDCPYDPITRSYEAKLHMSSGHPEKVVIRLLEQGSNVCLVSATLDYPDPVHTFSLDFLKQQGFAPIRRSSSEESNLNRLLNCKYEGRSPLNLMRFDNTFISNHGVHEYGPISTEGSLRQAAEILGLASKKIPFSKPENSSTNGKSSFSAMAALFASIIDAPHRPRFVIALTNNKTDAASLKAAILDYAQRDIKEIAKKSGINLIFSVSVLTSSALKEDHEESLELKQIKNSFQESLLKTNGSEVPISIIIGAKDSLGTGANLQLQLEFARMNQKELPPLLSLYMNGAPPLRSYKGASSLQIDASDFVLCMPLTHVFSEKYFVRALMTMMADSMIDPQLLRGKLGGRTLEIIPFLKRTELYGTAVMMSMVQFLGRIERTLNNPLGQTAWMHEEMAEYLGSVPDQLREDDLPPVKTPSLARLIASLKGLAADSKQTFNRCGVEEYIAGVIHPIITTNESTPKIVIAIELWKELRKFCITQQGIGYGRFSDSDQLSSLSLAMEKEQSTKLDSPSIRVRDLYMPINSASLNWPADIRKSSIETDATESGDVLIVEAIISEFEGRLYVAKGKSGIPEVARSSSWKCRWRIYDKEIVEQYDRFLHKKKGSNQKYSEESNSEKSNTLPEIVYLLKPIVISSISDPAIDELRTEKIFSLIRGVHIKDLPIGSFERDGDLYLETPGIIVDNKSYRVNPSRLNLGDVEVVNKFIDAGRSKLKHAQNSLMSSGSEEKNLPKVMVFLFRNGLTEEMHKKVNTLQHPEVIAFKKYSYDKAKIYGDEVFDTLFFIMPNKWKKEHLDYLIKIINAQNKNQKTIAEV